MDCHTNEVLAWVSITGCFTVMRISVFNGTWNRHNIRTRITRWDSQMVVSDRQKPRLHAGNWLGPRSGHLQLGKDHPVHRSASPELSTCYADAFSQWRSPSEPTTDSPALLLKLLPHATFTAGCQKEGSKRLCCHITWLTSVPSFVQKLQNVFLHVVATEVRKYNTAANLLGGVLKPGHATPSNIEFNLTVKLTKAEYSADFNIKVWQQLTTSQHHLCNGAAWSENEMSR